MEHEKQMQRNVAQALLRFVDVHLRVKPRAALVDIHENSMVVTLEGVVPPAERDYARDSENYELLEKSYAGVFECTRRMAEIELEQILDRTIKSSMMRIDPESGNAFLVFSLADG